MTTRTRPATPPALPELLTGAEVCQLLRISRSTLQPWREQGLLEAHPLPNGQYRYPRNQAAIVDALAAAGRRP